MLIFDKLFYNSCRDKSSQMRAKLDISIAFLSMRQKVKDVSLNCTRDKIQFASILERNQIRALIEKFSRIQGEYSAIKSGLNWLSVLYL